MEVLKSYIVEHDFIIIAAVFVVIYLLKRWYEKKRTNKLSMVAQRLGFSFYEQGQSDTLAKHKGFILFNNDESESIKNELSGYRDGLKVSVFGYKYSETTGTGEDRSTSTYQQTVVSIEAKRTSFPTFQLSPENWFDRLGQKLFGNDIDFENHEKFSKSYTLRGDDNTAIRELFSHEVIFYLESQTGLYIEAKDNVFIFYEPNKRCDTEDIEALLDKAVEVFRLFE